MPEIPKGFGTLKDLIKRADAARDNWQLWRSLHQEAFEFAAPQRETFRFWSPGQRKDRHIFDSTAIDGLVTFANIIQGALVPAWVQWMKLEPGQNIPEEEKDTVKEGLEDATDVFFSNLNHSNFSTEITPGFSDLGIGTGALLVEEGEFNREETLQFSNVPLAELHPEMPARGPIKNVWRPQELESRHIKTLWPQAEIPSSLNSTIKNKPMEKVKILNGMLFNPDDQLYWQLVIDKSSDSLIFTQSFNTRRLIVFRWHVTPGEMFGRGPIIQKLADIRTVNKVKQFILQNAAIQMSGVYTGRSDGIFNPHTVRIAPGVVIPVGSNGTANPSLQALPRAGDIGLGGIVLEDLQNGIKKALLASPLGEIQDPVRSATEQLLRNQEMLKERGASFGRLKTELIEPLVAAVVDILRGRGIFPDITVDGKDVTIKQASPLAKAEAMEDFQNSQVWFNSVSALPPEVVAGSVKIEELPKVWQQQLGVTSDLVRSDEERLQIAQAAQQAALTQLQGGLGGGAEQPAG